MWSGGRILLKFWGRNMVFKRTDSLETIADALAWIKLSCEQRGWLKLFSDNVVAQHFFCRLLNVAFDLSLVEMDLIQANYPSIDLGDPTNRIAYQVTTERKGDKVQHTLDKFVEHELEKQYDALRILIVGDRQATYKTVVVPAALKFDCERDILGIEELVRYIGTLDSGRLEKLQAVLSEELKEPVPPQSRHQKIAPTPEELEILLKTADSPEGVIHYIKYDGGFQLLTGTQQLVTDRNPRIVARWQAAIDRLLEMGLLKDNEHNGERLHLSTEGFDAVDRIRQQGGTGPEYAELEKDMPELLAEMSTDLKAAPLIREFVILDTKGNIYNGEGVFAYYRTSHDQLDPKLHILVNQGLITEHTYNNVDRYRFTEEFVKYLKKRV
jgi:hypothetical protein